MNCNVTLLLVTWGVILSYFVETKALKFWQIFSTTNKKLLTVVFAFEDRDSSLNLKISQLISITKLIEDDEAEKLEQLENQLAHSRFGPLIAPSQRKKECQIHLDMSICYVEDSQLAKITRDNAKITGACSWFDVTSETHVVVAILKLC
uniref:Uncharacterized protein n=1 Tax=Cucumis melo TaxID=3656 RepID=A0A9I9EIS7_CUCME